MVGCVPIADRTYAAGSATTSTCLFCNAAKEDISFTWLAIACPCQYLQRPDDDPDFGPNFSFWASSKLDGIAHERLKMSTTEDILVAAWGGFLWYTFAPVDRWLSCLRQVFSED